MLPTYVAVSTKHKKVCTLNIKLISVRDSTETRMFVLMTRDSANYFARIFSVRASSSSQLLSFTLSAAKLLFITYSSDSFKQHVRQICGFFASFMFSIFSTTQLKSL